MEFINKIVIIIGYFTSFDNEFVEFFKWRI